MATRLFRRVGTACLLVAALVMPAQARALPTLSHHGRWLTDPQGRVVILHGVQVDRFEPSQPVEFIDLSPANVQFMASQGFNLARVSLAYAGVEPQPGHTDSDYVNSYLAFDRGLASRGVYDLLDMMQGQYSQLVDGWGFPNWMTNIGSTPNNPQPFPNGYFENPAEETAWDSLWSNAPASDGAGILDHYVAGLHRLAGQFAGSPGLLGMEILNEPWPGSQWPSCASPAGCPPGGFDQTSLTSAYNRLIGAIRSADPLHPILYEPNLLFDYGAPTGLGNFTDPNLVFAFHNYCLAYGFGLPDPFGNCGTDEQMVMANADARGASSGDGLLMDEWGNVTNTTTLERIAAEADQHMVGWSYWAYEDCCNSAAAIVKDGTKDPGAPGNLNLPVLQALVRPYPQLVSGSPTSWSFDPQADQFTLQFSTRGVAGQQFPGSSPTEVFIPQLQYPHGYRVSVTGADIASQPTDGRLLLCSHAGAASVTVTVGPDSASTTDLPATPAPDPSCPSQAGAGTSSTGPGAVPVTVSHGGGVVAAPGTGTVRLPGTGRCLTPRTIHVRLHLARGARLLRVSARINGRHRAVRVGRHGLIAVRLPAGRRRAVKLHLAIRVRTRRGVRTLYINRRYTTC